MNLDLFSALVLNLSSLVAIQGKARDILLFATIKLFSVELCRAYIDFVRRVIASVMNGEVVTGNPADLLKLTLN